MNPMQEPLALASRPCRPPPRLLSRLARWRPPLWGFVRNTLARIRLKMELHRYTPHTIAVYLRRQGAQVGEGCVIIPNTLGTEPYLVKLGNRVVIAGGVTFITHDGATALLRHEVPELQNFGPIVIEDNVVVGFNAVLFGNIRIGANSIVGAGSVVIADVPPGTIVMGNPARPIGSTAKYREKALARWAIQKPPGMVIEPGATWWNSRHYARNRELLRAHLLRVFEGELGAQPGAGSPPEPPERAVNPP
jgi:acetyltransferase-like isoleucine patch superfamily enzyme